MAYRNLDEFAVRLEQAGELIVTSGVSLPPFALTHSAVIAAEQGKAIRFDGIAGGPFSLVANLFSTAQRMAWALGLDDLSELRQRIDALVTFDEAPSFGSLLSRGGLLLSAFRSASTRPANGAVPVQAVQQPHPDTTTLPALHLWPQDSHARLTGGHLILAQGVTQRVLPVEAFIIGEQTVAVPLDPALIATLPDSTPAAIAFGGDPALIWGTHTPLPVGVHPYWLAGWTRRRPIATATAITQPLEIPAAADLILEGQLRSATQPGAIQAASESGCVVEHRDWLVLHLTAVTHRVAPVLPVLLPAPGWSQERHHMKQAAEQVFTPLIRLVVDEICAIRLVPQGGPGGLAVISCHSRHRGQGRKVMNAIWGIGALAGTKTLVVVDEQVDIYDDDALRACICAINVPRDLVMQEGPLYDLLGYMGYGTRLGIDATRVCIDESAAIAVQRIHEKADTDEIHAGPWRVRVDRQAAETLTPTMLLHHVLTTVDWASDLTFDEAGVTLNAVRAGRGLPDALTLAALNEALPVEPASHEHPL